MDRGHSPQVAYQAAANELLGAYELVGNSAVRTNGITMAYRAGLPEGKNFQKETERHIRREVRQGNIHYLPLGWDKKSDLSGYRVSYLEDTNSLLLTPIEGDAITMNKQVRIPMEAIGRSASGKKKPAVDPELVQQGIEQREQDAAFTADEEAVMELNRQQSSRQQQPRATPRPEREPDPRFPPTTGPQ